MLSRGLPERLPYLQKVETLLKNKEQEFTTVVSADDMDDETFIKHFNYRHVGDLEGISRINVGLDDEILRMYRSFHDHVHNWLRRDIPHDHRRNWEQD